jgi:hypothetical protein
MSLLVADQQVDADALVIAAGLVASKMVLRIMITLVTAQMLGASVRAVASLVLAAEPLGRVLPTRTLVTVGGPPRPIAVARIPYRFGWWRRWWSWL